MKITFNINYINRNIIWVIHRILCKISQKLDKESHWVDAVRLAYGTCPGIAERNGYAAVFVNIATT